MPPAVLPVTVRSHISAPRERVFDVIADLAVRPAWAPHLEWYHLLTPRSAGVGAGARFRLDTPLLGNWAETTIAEAERPRRIREEGRMGRLGRTRTGALYELTDQGAGVTRVELTMWTEPAGASERLREGLGLRGWMRRRGRRSLELLRRQLEERPDEPLERVAIAGFEQLKAPRWGI